MLLFFNQATIDDELICQEEQETERESKRDERARERETNLHTSGRIMWDVKISKTFKKLNFEKENNFFEGRILKKMILI